MAHTNMFVKYMQIELTTNSANLEEVESLLRLWSLLFRTVGEPPFMTSLRIIWWCATGAMLELEHQHFPDLPAELHVTWFCQIQCIHVPLRVERLGASAAVDLPRTRFASLIQWLAVDGIRPSVP